MKPVTHVSALRREVHAFTLVELLVVIGIIALLIGILLPTLSRAREQANSTLCLSRLRTLGTAMIMYTQAYHGWLPESGVGQGLSSAATNDTTGLDWIGWPGNYKTLDGSAIAPYLGKPNPVLLGNVNAMFPGTVNTAVPGINPILFRCPSDDWTVRTSQTYLINGVVIPYPYSYVMNEFLGPGYGYLGEGDGTTEAQQCAPKLTNVRLTSQKIMLYEEDAGTLDDGNGQPNFLGNGYPSLLSVRHTYHAKNTNGSTSTTNIPYPSGKGNVVFCDGSAASIPRSLAHTPLSFYPLQN